MKAKTYITIEALCPSCGGLKKDVGGGHTAFVNSMASACALVKRHVEETGHTDAFARLTQETGYEDA